MGDRAKLRAMSTGRGANLAIHAVGRAAAAVAAARGRPSAPSRREAEALLRGVVDAEA
jgi:hypothetical protein